MRKEKQKAARKETSLGIVIIIAFYMIKLVISLPDFLSGVIHALGFCLIIIGVLPDKAYEKLKSWKMSLFKSE